jgi:transcriptional regulator with XRE-family HTH domain
VLRHRGRTGLTQRELAARLGASVRTLQDWEAGSNHPSGARLQALIATLLAAGGLHPGREAEEARALWAAVLREAPRMRVPLDEAWLADLLAGRAAGQPQPEPDAGASPVVPAPSTAELDAAGERLLDWGDAPDVVGFVGRAQELTVLRGWVLQGCRLVAVLGAGGIGKTILTARLTQDLVRSFRRVYWRSLRDAPPCHDWLGGAIGFLSDHRVAPPEGEAARLDAVLRLLRERPSLLVLDNFDTLRRPGDPEGRYRDGYGGYGRLLHALGAGRHRSCLVLTSRELPPELAGLTGGTVRTLEVGGLDAAAGQLLLAHKHLSGSPEAWAALIARFAGNGLALKVAGESIREVFGGDLGAFLQEAGAGTAFGGIRRLLAEQLERCSALEQQVLRALAVAREPATLAELLADLGQRAGRGAVLEAVGALRRRSLLERAGTSGRAAFTLQSVVLEYVTDQLVDEVSEEIGRGQPDLLVDQPLILAQAKDYVRQTQERLIGEPILQHLRGERATGSAEQPLLVLLERFRNRPQAEHGYGPGNAVNLLRLQRGDLRGIAFDRLTLRSVYLAGVDARDASLAGAHLSEAVLADAFSFPICVALSGDGALLAAGTSTGDMWLWRVADRTPLLALRAHAG